MITRAGFWAMESEKHPVTAADFDHEAEWDRETATWEFDDGSKGSFTKVKPLMKTVGSETTLWSYRFEALSK